MGKLLYIVNIDKRERDLTAIIQFLRQAEKQMQLSDSRTKNMLPLLADMIMVAEDEQNECRNVLAELV